MTYNHHAPRSPRETAYLMIQHRVVDGVPTTANVRILSTNNPATIGDVFWTCDAGVFLGLWAREALKAQRAKRVVSAGLQINC